MSTYNLKENLKLTTALALSKTLQSEDLKRTWRCPILCLKTYIMRRT